MIVVSDTSPLNYLIVIDAIELLPRLFADIHAPTRVIQELQRSRAPLLVRQWAHSPPEWLQLSMPTTKIATSVRLDPGEIEAIALAKELRAQTILIDERKGRRVAREHGLRAVGTVAVLELAAERKMLDLKSSLEALQRSTFYITDEYIDAALERDAARQRR